MNGNAAPAARGADRTEPQLQEGSIRAIIAERHTAAQDIVTLTLVAADGTRLPEFEPGAHIDLEIAPGLVRQYSICSDPANQGTYRLAILREPSSRGGSVAVHKNLTAGQVVTISRPRNNFPLIESAKRSLLFAGGIGITPLLAMAYRLKALGADYALYYCCRARSRAAFLEEIQKQFGERASFYFDDDPASSSLDLGRALTSPEDAVHLYTCGPAGFMDYVIAGAAGRGWQERQIHKEYFRASSDTAGATNTGSFTVYAARSGITVEVPQEQTIAQALLERGVNVVLSCGQGICGTCLVTVLEGTPEHHDMFQTDDEKTSNTRMTICCSRAKSPRLVLDI